MEADDVAVSVVTAPQRLNLHKSDNSGYRRYTTKLQTMVNPALIQHNETQFKKSIEKLCTGVWTAIGYSASTQHMIEGKSTVTIVDTSESTAAAENVLAEFKKLTDKPVGRIIYTHSHRDHISGASVFSEGRDIPILACSKFQSDLVG